MDHTEIKRIIQSALARLSIIPLVLIGLVVVTAVGFLVFHRKGPPPNVVVQTTALAQPASQAISPKPTKKIYLTLDMDMNEKMQWLTSRKRVLEWYDPALFSYLESNDVPTTFFVSGLFAKTYPSLIQALAAYSIFSFQNHSYDESSFTPGCYWLQTLSTDQEKTDQIQATETILKQLTGQTATYFRFPGLCHSSENDTLVQNLGFTINDATINGGDPFNENTGAIVNAVMSQARDNGVIVMHIGGPNAPKSLAALEIIVPKLRAEGYAFLKLP